MAFFITQECTGCGSCKRICPTQSIEGEKKEYHTILSGTCIDCGACGRICPAQSVEDNFGILADRVKKKDWEKPQFDKKLCMSCCICIDACP
ncbi:MAG: 4Fe-4S dicluster domain-containing protein, partial [Desulfobacteraceae bacterium]|nr:4Fe-4S dicluster domain-containing protein [Desulfobacteraceae bacterium]